MLAKLKGFNVLFEFKMGEVLHKQYCIEELWYSVVEPFEFELKGGDTSVYFSYLRTVMFEHPQLTKVHKMEYNDFVAFRKEKEKYATELAEKNQKNQSQDTVSDTSE